MTQLYCYRSRARCFWYLIIAPLLFFQTNPVSSSKTSFPQSKYHKAVCTNILANSNLRVWNARGTQRLVLAYIYSEGIIRIKLQRRASVFVCDMSSQTFVTTFRQVNRSSKIRGMIQFTKIFRVLDFQLKSPDGLTQIYLWKGHKMTWDLRTRQKSLNVGCPRNDVNMAKAVSQHVGNPALYVTLMHKIVLANTFGVWRQLTLKTSQVAASPWSAN